MNNRELLDEIVALQGATYYDLKEAGQELSKSMQASDNPDPIVFMNHLAATMNCLQKAMKVALHAQQVYLEETKREAMRIG